MARKPRPTSQLLGTTLVAVLLLAQCLGLQQLCLCGSCAISEALGLGAAPEPAHAHSCCAERARAEAAAESHDTRPRLVQAGDPCGCGAKAHARYDEPAVHRDQPTLRAPMPTLAVLACPPALVQVASGMTGANGVLRSRGPPSADGPPLYLQYRMLRI